MRVVKQQPLIFGDFMSQGGDQKPYVEIQDHDKVTEGNLQTELLEGGIFLVKILICSDRLENKLNFDFVPLCRW